MNRWQPKDPLKAAARRSRARRLIGKHARCACGENRPEALIRGTKPMRCAACQRKRQGRTTIDDHHVASQNNHPLTLLVPVNEHRAMLTVMQMDWSPTLRENPSGCPVIAGAAMLRGAADTILYLIEKGIDWVIRLMEILSGFLRERWGDRWWLNTPLAAFAPSR
jgi:hypothetical protein